MAKNKYNNSEFGIFRMWMAQELKLGGSDLLIYSFFYKYSIGKLGFYYGGYDHIQALTGIPRSTLIRRVNDLVDRELILKETKTLDNGLQRNFYRVNVEKLAGIESDDLKEAFEAIEANESNWENYSNVL